MMQSIDTEMMRRSSATRNEKEIFIRINDDEPSMMAYARDVLKSSAADADVNIKTLGHRLARKYGRGAFHVRFASMEAMEQCNAESIQKRMLRKTLRQI